MDMIEAFFKIIEGLTSNVVFFLLNKVKWGFSTMDYGLREKKNSMVVRYILKIKCFSMMDFEKKHIVLKKRFFLYVKKEVT